MIQYIYDRGINCIVKFIYILSTNTILLKDNIT